MQTDTLELNPQAGRAKAFVTLPDPQPSAAVLLIQEWWGVNQHIHDIAGRYAAEGYICVTPDLYRGKVATDSEEASRLMHELDVEDGMATIRSAVEETKRKYNVSRVGITGYCMGGTFALRAACDIEELNASAPFYGDIPDEETLSRLRVPTLFIAGERDQWITPEKVEGLKEAARKYNLPVEVVSYDADHAFFNDTRPEVYNAQAAQDAWRRVLDLFDNRLRA
ncbi:MAG TPA: dienelactone hydrolase family protein [Pyrinomonadaceae bacterium]|nr:dienelactone hydrolase family protein [Pyrinomonadaceae bacterium]